MKPRRGSGQVRIIGGTLRGRRIPVPDQPGLRPTPDRTRETLFNWLGPLHGYRVLDLFAGTGALGLEACSRGAQQVILIEQSARAAEALREIARAWQLYNAEVIQADALQWLATAEHSGDPFDLVFLDPPFDSDLLHRSLESLCANAMLAPGAKVYLECSSRQSMPATPEKWRLHRQGSSPHTTYALYES